MSCDEGNFLYLFIRKQKKGFPVTLLSRVILWWISVLLGVFYSPVVNWDANKATSSSFVPKNIKKSGVYVFVKITWYLLFFITPVWHTWETIWYLPINSYQFFKSGFCLFNLRIVRLLWFSVLSVSFSFLIFCVDSQMDVGHFAVVAISIRTCNFIVSHCYRTHPTIIKWRIYVCELQIHMDVSLDLDWPIKNQLDANDIFVLLWGYFWAFMLHYWIARWLSCCTGHCNHL